LQASPSGASWQPARAGPKRLASAGLLLLCSIGFAAVASAETPAQPRPAQPSRLAHGSAFKRGEVLVRFKHSTPGSERADVRSAQHARIVESLSIPNLERLKLDRGRSVEKAVASLERDDNVLYAEPNYIYQTAALPNDPSLAQQWALQNLGQEVNGVAGTAGADIDAPQAWDLTTGSHSVKVGIVDTGVAYTSPDLAPNIYTDPQTGEHGHGFISGSVEGNDARDHNGHGSHVAGIIGSTGNNAFGTAGVNWNVSLMSLRAFSSSGNGSADNIADAFVYAGEHGVKIVNASFAGGSPSRAVMEAIGRSEDTLFVAAAGNWGGNFTLWPCGYTYENVICVTATDQSDRLAQFATWDDEAVDLAAPGANVLSWYPPTKKLFEDDFETGPAGRWTAGGEGEPWQRTTRFFSSPTHGFSDSPDGPYTSITDAVAQIVPAFDFTGLIRCSLSFYLHLDFASSDYLVIEDRVPGYGWGGIDWFINPVEGQQKTYLRDWPGSGYRIRFRFQREHPDGVREGADIDDVVVHCDEPGAPAYRLEYLSGTSMATPQVTGVAALLWALHPDASVAEVKNAILDGVDELPSLEGKVATGGRLNAYKSLTVPLRKPPSFEPGTITTVGGIYYPGFKGEGVPLKDAWFNLPGDIDALPDGGYLIADMENHRVRRVDPTGRITTVAGTGGTGLKGDGGPATEAAVGWPRSIAVTPDDGFLIASLGLAQKPIRKVWPDGHITTVACRGKPGFGGDGRPALWANCERPSSVAATADGGFLFADTGNRRVRRVWPNGIVTTVLQDENEIFRVASTADGGFLYSDLSRVRRVSGEGDVTTIAGDGKPGFEGDGGAAVEARLEGPSDFESTPDGGLLIADADNNRIRRVTPAGTIVTVAGSPLIGFGGDGGPATKAQLWGPSGIALTLDGGFLLTDTGNNRIRFVDSYPLEVGRSTPAPPAQTAPSPPELPVTPNGPAASLVTQLPRLTARAARSKAKAALKRRYGRAYRHGRKKRLSCSRRSSTRYRCRFGFVYAGKRHSGRVTVELTGKGVKTTVRQVAA
jgi:subtilisin family serine protease